MTELPILYVAYLHLRDRDLARSSSCVAVSVVQGQPPNAENAMLHYMWIVLNHSIPQTKETELRRERKDNKRIQGWVVLV